jgi:type II pantothenate kinase
MQGELAFSRVTNDQINVLFEGLKNLQEKYEIENLHVTGGGAYKYSKELKEIDASYGQEQEIGSLLKGLNFMMENIDDYSFSYRDATGHVFLQEEPEYPFLVVNIGSGVSAVKVTGKEEFTRVGGTSLGGGTLLGLMNLLVGTNDFDELLEMATRGSRKDTDLLIKEIYNNQGSSSPKSSSSAASDEEDLAVGMGRLAIDHLRNIRKMKKEDMVKNFLTMVVFNIAQVAYYLAKKERIGKIFFTGTFIKGHPDIMECLSHTVDYFSTHNDCKIDAAFLKHDGFLGAIGCAVQALKKECNDDTLGSA